MTVFDDPSSVCACFPTLHWLHKTWGPFCRVHHENTGRADTENKVTSHQNTWWETTKKISGKILRSSKFYLLLCYCCWCRCCWCCCCYCARISVVLKVCFDFSLHFFYTNTRTIISLVNDMEWRIISTSHLSAAHTNVRSHTHAVRMISQRDTVCVAYTLAALVCVCNSQLILLKSEIHLVFPFSLHVHLTCALILARRIHARVKRQYCCERARIHWYR